MVREHQADRNDGFVSGPPLGYLLSGTLHVATEDGGDAEIRPGEAYEIQPGHDGWVVGEESVMAVEFSA